MGRCCGKSGNDGDEINASRFIPEAPLVPPPPPGEEGEEIVCLDNVHKTYLLGVEGVPALRGCNMSVKRGEFVTIVGTSGGGKTSLLNIIGTIDRPTKGDVTLAGKRIVWNTSDRVLAHIRLHRLGFVFQTFNLIGSMSARENVELPMILAGSRSLRQRRKRSKELLSRVGLGRRMNHKPAMLSGGEQQRVTIARAIANDPDILLLDEPTGDLDSKNTDIVMRLLTELNAEGITLIMVTHDVNLIGYSHKTVHMRDGKVQKVDDVPESRRVDMHEDLFEKLKSRAVVSHEREEHSGEFANTEVRQPSNYASFCKVVDSNDSDLENSPSIVPHAATFDMRQSVLPFPLATQDPETAIRNEMERVLRLGFASMSDSDQQTIDDKVAALLGSFQQAESGQQNILNEEPLESPEPVPPPQIPALPTLYDDVSLGIRQPQGSPDGSKVPVEHLVAQFEGMRPGDGDSEDIGVQEVSCSLFGPNAGDEMLDGLELPAIRRPPPPMPAFATPPSSVAHAHVALGGLPAPMVPLAFPAPPKESPDQHFSRHRHQEDE